MESLSRCLLLFLLLAASMSALAQPGRYQVELILFEHLFPSSEGELLRPAGSAVNLGATPGVVPEAVNLYAHSASPGSEYVLLAPAQHRLQGVWAVLSRSAEYRPLMHLAWQQPGRRDAAPVLLRGAVPCNSPQAEPPLLQGTARLQDPGKLFFTLEFDYQLCAQGPPTSPGGVRHHQRVLLDRLYYLDHPLLGVLLRISRVQSLP